MAISIKDIKPLSDRVVVEPIEKEEVTPSGIVLPETAKEKPQEGLVLAAGPGRLLDSGERAPMEGLPPFSGGMVTVIVMRTPANPASVLIASRLCTVI